MPTSLVQCECAIKKIWQLKFLKKNSLIAPKQHRRNWNLTSSKLYGISIFWKFWLFWFVWFKLKLRICWDPIWYYWLQTMLIATVHTTNYKLHFLRLEPRAKMKLEILWANYTHVFLTEKNQHFPQKDNALFRRFDANEINELGKKGWIYGGNCDQIWISISMWKCI